MHMVRHSLLLSEVLLRLDQLLEVFFQSHGGIGDQDTVWEEIEVDSYLCTNI